MSFEDITLRGYVVSMFPVFSRVQSLTTVPRRVQLSPPIIVVTRCSQSCVIFGSREGRLVIKVSGVSLVSFE